MARSRTYYSLKNVNYAVAFQLCFFIMQFLLRKIFVSTLPPEYLGINGTFASIISVLSIAELGVGSAITFSMYKPLAEDDKPAIIALMQLYRKTYVCIALVITAIGLILLPFIPKLAGTNGQIDNIRLIYVLFLMESVSSYFFIYKQSLICADQKQFIQTKYKYGIQVILSILQGVLLIVTHSYLIYLCLRIAMTILTNVLLSRKANEMYPFLTGAERYELEANTKEEIIKNIKAMMAHKIGGAAVLGTDNLLIAVFVGVIEVGKYSNYYMVVNGLNVLYVFVFAALVGSIGNLGASGSESSLWKNFKRIRFASNWLYGFSTTCLVVLFQPFIRLWVGDDYLFSFPIVILIVINFYITGMRNAVLSFREALGLFWYDRYKPFAETLINLLVSIILARKLGVAGIFIGTMVSTITTCFWVEPHILYKYGFKKPLREYFICYLGNTVLTVVAVLITLFVSQLIPGAGMVSFAGKLLVCLILPNAAYMIVFRNALEFKYYANLLKQRVLEKE